MITPPVIVRATVGGTPRCRSIHPRIDGPSLSRKKRLSAASERPNATEARPRIPLIRPVVSVEMMVGTSALTCSEALAEAGLEIPTLSSQSWPLAAAAEACSAIESVWEVIPPMTSKRMTTATATMPTRTSAAAAARGMWRLSQPTTGMTTVATIVATTTGPAIVSVAPRNQTSPMISRTNPTSSQAVRPMSFSHLGAAKVLPSACSSSLGMAAAAGSAAGTGRRRRGCASAPPPSAVIGTRGAVRRRGRRGRR